MQFWTQRLEKRSREDWIISMVTLLSSPCWLLLRPLKLPWSQSFLNINRLFLLEVKDILYYSSNILSSVFELTRSNCFENLVKKNSGLLEMKVISVISFKFAFKTRKQRENKYFPQVYEIYILSKHSLSEDIKAGILHLLKIISHNWLNLFAWIEKLTSYNMMKHYFLDLITRNSIWKWHLVSYVWVFNGLDFVENLLCCSEVHHT